MSWFGNASEWFARDFSGSGGVPLLLRVYQLAHCTTAVSLLVISASLIWLYRKRKGDLPFPRMFPLMGVLFALLGLTHLGSVMVSFWPPHRLLGLLAVLTALVAVTASARLPVAVQSLALFPSCEAVQRLNESLQNELRQQAQARQELALENARLKSRVKKLENLLRTKAWMKETNGAIEELSRLLAGRETC